MGAGKWLVNMMWAIDLFRQKSKACGLIIVRAVLRGGLAITSLAKSTPSRPINLFG